MKSKVAYGEHVDTGLSQHVHSVIVAPAWINVICIRHQNFHVAAPKCPKGEYR